MNRKIDEKRQREENEAAASVYKEFVETFQNPQSSAVSKTWVKAGTYDAGTRKEDNRDKGKLYKPMPKHLEEKTNASTQEYGKMLATNDSKKDLLSTKRKTQDKKKSNLELFKEELRQ